MLIAGAIAAVFFAVIIWGGDVWRWYAERLDAPPNVGAVDVEALHAEHFPAWVVAASRGIDSEPAREKLTALREAVKEDGNLAELLRRLKELTTSDKLADRGEDLTRWFSQWNGYLDEQGVPYQLTGGLMAGDNVHVWATSLHTLADLQVRVGDRTVRARVFERVDDTNLREFYLGAAQPAVDGAVILSDRVLEYALDRLWPVLDPATADADLFETARPFAATIRKEVAGGLPADALRVLQQTAAARLEIVVAADAIRSRTDCSRFIISRIPWRGFSERDLSNMARAVDDWSDCPGVKPSEHEALERGSQALRRVEDLRPAIESLLAWSTRTIALHEARHVADAEDNGGLEERLDCSICKDRDGASVTAELSAYVASIAWSDSPATALYQACDAVADQAGSHRRALELLLDATSSSCNVEPVQPAEAMQALEQRAFERSDAITLPEDYPASLPLPRREAD